LPGEFGNFNGISRWEKSQLAPKSAENCTDCFMQVFNRTVLRQDMKKCEILLVNPWITDFAAYDLWAKPLGLLYLGDMLRRQEGINVRLLDCLDLALLPPALRQTVKRRRYGTGHYFQQDIEKPAAVRDVPRRYKRYGLPEEIFRDCLANLPAPDVVLVTSRMTYWYPGVRQTIRIIKETYPDVPVILGGIYATLCPEHAKEVCGADLVLSGVEEDRVLAVVKHLAQPSGEKAPHPFPVFDLQRRIPYVVIATSYGCPFACRYCASRLLKPRFSQRPPEEVVAEIEFWHRRYGVVDFAFYDDALLVNFDRHLAVILEGVLSLGLEVRFHTPNALHLRLVNAEVARLLKRAAFQTLRFGLETADPKRRARLDQKVDAEDFTQAMAYLKEAGFRPEQLGVYLLWGLPDQDLEEVKASALYVARHGALPYLAEYSPIPGTPLFEEALKIARYPLDEDPLFHNNSCFPCLSRPDWRAIEETKRFVRALRAEVSR